MGKIKTLSLIAVSVSLVSFSSAYAGQSAPSEAHGSTAGAQQQSADAQFRRQMKRDEQRAKNRQPIIIDTGATANQQPAAAEETKDETKKDTE